MGQFTEDQLKSSITAGIRAYHIAKGYGAAFSTVDPLLTDLVAAEIAKLFYWAAAAPDADEEIKPGPMIAGEALIGVSEAERDLTIDITAYELALKNPNACWGMRYIHECAAEIAGKLREGLKPQNHVVQTITVKIEPDTSAFQEAIDSIFGKVEWRREGWNDAKAVMLRTLTRQIKHPDNDGYVLRNFRQRDLEMVRLFVGSFQFDPNHEKS